MLQFLAREIAMTPPGGLNFVDARDVAALLPVAMDCGKPGERYLVGGENWTFADLFGRLERLTKVPAPAELKGDLQPLSLARAGGAVQVWAAGAHGADQRRDGAVLLVLRRRQGGARARLRPARRADTLRDTVNYVRRNLLGSGALSSTEPAGGATAA